MLQVSKILMFILQVNFFKCNIPSIYFINIYFILIIQLIEVHLRCSCKGFLFKKTYKFNNTWSFSTFWLKRHFKAHLQYL